MRFSRILGAYGLLAITSLIGSTAAAGVKADAKAGGKAGARAGARVAAQAGAPKGHSPQFYDVLTQEYVCQRFHHLAERMTFIFNFEPMRKALYDVEFDLDLFDADMDNSDLSIEFSDGEEKEIANCYRYYAETMIEALDILADRMEDLDSKSARYLLVTINSLRVADYNAVYELGRRLHDPVHLTTIFKKYGALDGSTPYSVRTAFQQFETIPTITGEDFRTLP
ncbi:uncharacterized protein F5Z01DRAFT_749436 [Emericellopsis atlantica]|uniref:Uncharacterized protein n=1 Tax=Emericellopsis atlantica TaxID=2614577 RepID=A0A9P7ZNF1_9HYPO|nr:uncharacterized protein F5Z01DRAFT_749436 [Emericellopsis atlantica]KAG9255235.1 hypothetical protein F5Z01DRAFT_749436 [Emericellopsis atlantica]